MEVFQSSDVMRAWSHRKISAGKTIALVPTMGFFHEGHLRLMKKAHEMADYVVVSLFVNPIQFGPSEDYSTYPRDFDHDASMAAKEGIDVLFVPDSREMYPEAAVTRISVEPLATTLCGASRPGHFEGVCTVVAKLFHIVLPHAAVFGRKDFQQLAVIRRMVKDLSWDISIIGHPIVREADGLAMSSRNRYLSEKERQSALGLYTSIQYARKLVRNGVVEVARIVHEASTLIQSSEDNRIDYVQVVDQDTLAEQQEVDEHSIMIMAVWVGRTRLIDNGALFEGE